MIKNIFPLILLFILVSPISWTSKGENSYQNNFKTLVTLSSQSSKILSDFQGKDKMDTQRNESSPRSNRINSLKIDDDESLSEIEKKALRLPQKSSRAFLMLVHSVRFCRLCYTPMTNISQEIQIQALNHLAVDKVIELKFPTYYGTN